MTDRWKPVETYECPKCGEVYQSPIQLTKEEPAMFHTVKEQGKPVRHYMKKVKK